MGFVDPKTTLLNLLKNNVRVMRYDGNLANIDVCFDFPEKEVLQRLAEHDILVSVGRTDEKTTRLGLGATFKYVGLYQIGVWTKDPSCGHGEDLCKDTIQRIKETIRTFEKTPGDNLAFLRKINTKDDDRVGSPTLFHRIVTCETWHYGQEEL